MAFLDTEPVPLLQTGGNVEINLLEETRVAPYESPVVTGRCSVDKDAKGVVYVQQASRGFLVDYEVDYSSRMGKILNLMSSLRFENIPNFGKRLVQLQNCVKSGSNLSNLTFISRSRSVLKSPLRSIKRFKTCLHVKELVFLYRMRILER